MRQTTFPAGYVWAVSGGTAWLAGTESAEDTALSNDPIDPNYTQFAAPAISSPLLFPSASGVNGAMVTAFNTLAATSSQFTGLTAALLTSLNRAHGAAQAGNTAWKNRQLAVAAGFATRAARLVSAEPALLARLQRAIAAAGIRVPVTAADSQQIQKDVAAHGLPSFLTRPLLAAGLDQHRMDQLAQDVADAPAHPGSITFPDLLTEPQLLAAIEGEATALRRFAAAVPRGVAAPAARAETPGARRMALHRSTWMPGPQQVRSTANNRAQARPSLLSVHRGAVQHVLYSRGLAARQIAAPETHIATVWRQFAAGACRRPPPLSMATTPTPSGSAGDLQQEGAITVGPAGTCTGCTWNTAGAGSLSGTVTADLPQGNITYTWTLPSRIPRSGAQGTLAIKVEPGRAGAFSNLEAELTAAGEVDAICGAGNPNCVHIEAYSKGGKTDRAASTFTLKARGYSAGRTQPVYVTIGCAWGGPAITIPYRVIQ